MSALLYFREINFLYEGQHYGHGKRNIGGIKHPIFGASLTGAVAPKELIHLRGRNGVGKTTLLKLIAGILLPSHGEMKNTFDTVCLIEESVFHPELLLIDNFKLFVGLNSKNPSPLLGQFHANMHELGLRPLENYYGELSQGFRARFRLYCAFSMQPDLLLLDEQTSSLDAQGRQWALTAWERFVDQGGSIIFTDHEHRTGVRLWDLSEAGLVTE